VKSIGTNAICLGTADPEPAGSASRDVSGSQVGPKAPPANRQIQ
jgi:hypothetical protein